MIQLTANLVSTVVLATSIAAVADDTAQRAAPRTAAVVVCFETTKHCISTTPAKGASAQPFELKARPEKIREIVSQVNLNARSDDEEPIESVRVNAAKIGTDVPGGLASLYWAAKNPLQAWRIFLPYPPQ